MIKCPECQSKKITFHHDFDHDYRFITCFTQNNDGKFIPTFNNEDIKNIEKGISENDINYINGNPLYSCNNCTSEFDNNDII